MARRRILTDSVSMVQRSMAGKSSVMGRPKGKRNADYEVQRHALVGAILPHLVSGCSSMRELAGRAGVSPSTLQHYFDGREALTDAALAVSGERGEPFLRAGATGEAGDTRSSLTWFLRFSVQGWRDFGVGPLHCFGIRAGLEDPAVGASYLTHILEPTLRCAEERLKLHADRGELALDHLRMAALALFAPVLLALLHQDGLGGNRVRPMDVDSLIEHHVDGFLRSYATAAFAATST